MLFRSEQEAADQAKAEKKAQTAAKRKANEGQKAEVMTLVSRFGIEDEAWSHLVQDRWPTPNVIAATYLLVLTLVQNILKRAIDMNEDIGAETVMWGCRQQEEFCVWGCALSNHAAIKWSKHLKP